ncbi:MAG: ABC transporter ATP-binding protein [Rubrivivax sp.]|nr:ABC transporter ATP-binding protein [Rubrivivax sp.]
MAALTLQGLGKRYGAASVVQGIDLRVADGEFMVLVGPSGCGKSTTLRMVAGLEDVSEGRILIGSDDVTHQAPAERGVAMVFQSYALYPHMTVAQNMGFGLKMAGQLPKAEVQARVQRAAASLQLEALLERRPAQLSGGQRQRVAIGRAIVREPRVFLFDEPLSNLDAALRTQMRAELAALHQRLGATIVYVTHDQVEAMTLGDRIAVFNAGCIEQVGAPMALYEQPANRFVAGFLGSPRMNFLPAAVAAPLAGRLAEGTTEVGVRPEHLQLAPDGAPGLPASLMRVENLGDLALLHWQVAGLPEALVHKTGLAPASLPVPGVQARLRCDPARLVCFDARGHRLG